MVTRRELLAQGRVRLARFQSVTVPSAAAGIILFRANPIRSHREVWSQDASNSFRFVEGGEKATDTFGRIVNPLSGVVQLGAEVGAVVEGQVHAKAQTSDVVVTVVEYEFDLKPGEVLQG